MKNDSWLKKTFHCLRKSYKKDLIYLKNNKQIEVINIEKEKLSLKNKHSENPSNWMRKSDSSWKKKLK